jgi:hypothetical protein
MYIIDNKKANSAQRTSCRVMPDDVGQKEIISLPGILYEGHSL